MEPTILSMSSAMPNIYAWDYLVVTSIFSALHALCAKFFTKVSSLCHAALPLSTIVVFPCFYCMVKMVN